MAKISIWLITYCQKLSKRKVLIDLPRLIGLPLNRPQAMLISVHGPVHTCPEILYRRPMEPTTILLPLRQDPTCSKRTDLTRGHLRIILHPSWPRAQGEGQAQTNLYRDRLLPIYSGVDISQTPRYLQGHPSPPQLWIGLTVHCMVMQETTASLHLTMPRAPGYSSISLLIWKYSQPHR